MGYGGAFPIGALNEYGLKQWGIRPESDNPTHQCKAIIVPPYLSIKIYRYANFLGSTLVLEGPSRSGTFNKYDLTESQYSSFRSNCGSIEVAKLGSFSVSGYWDKVIALNNGITNYQVDVGSSTTTTSS